MQRDRVARPVEEFKRTAPGLKFEDKVVTAQLLYVSDMVHRHYRPVGDRVETSPPSTGVLSILLAKRGKGSLTTIGGRITRHHLRVDRRRTDSQMGTSQAVAVGPSSEHRPLKQGEGSMATWHSFDIRRTSW